MNRSFSKILIILLACAVLVSAVGCGSISSAISDSLLGQSDDVGKSATGIFGTEGAHGEDTVTLGDKSKAGSQGNIAGVTNGNGADAADGIGANGVDGTNGAGGVNGIGSANVTGGANGPDGANGVGGASDVGGASGVGDASVAGSADVAGGTGDTYGKTGVKGTSGTGGSAGTAGTDADDQKHSGTKREENLAQIPHHETRYYISQFKDKLLDDFAQLYIATKNHEKECYFINKVTKEELDALIFALKYDCPELFCLDNIKTYYQEGDEERNIVKVNIDYVMSAKEYKEKLSEAEKAVQKIIRRCKGNSYEKRLIAYEYLTNNCNYNLHTLNCGNAYGALVEMQTKCDGISLAYMWLLEELGEECFVAAGTSPGEIEGHGWNVVKKDGKYYASDLTADLAHMEGTSKTCNWYPAFNVATDWVKDLYTISETPAFFKTATGYDMSQNYHVRNGSFCYESEDLYQKIYQTIDEAAHEVDNAAMIQFETNEMYARFLDEYGQIIKDWAEDNKCTNVEYTYGSMEDYRTVQLIVKAGFAEAADEDDGGDAA